MEAGTKLTECLANVYLSDHVPWKEAFKAGPLISLMKGKEQQEGENQGLAEPLPSMGTLRE